MTFRLRRKKLEWLVVSGIPHNDLGTKLCSTRQKKRLGSSLNGRKKTSFLECIPKF